MGGDDGFTHGDADAPLRPVAVAVAALSAAVDALQGADLTGLPEADLVAVLDAVERQARRLPAVRDALVGQVKGRDVAGSQGTRSTSAWLQARYLIGLGEARTWLRGAERLTARVSMTGEPLEPLLPDLAAARAAGDLSPTQVKIIDDLDDELPGDLPVRARREVEQAMLAYARQAGPTRLLRAGQRLLDVVDPDGAEPQHEEAHRRRGLTIGPLRHGLARISGHVDAWTREALLAILTSFSDTELPPHTRPPTSAGSPIPTRDAEDRCTGTNGNTAHGGCPDRQPADGRDDTDDDEYVGHDGYNDDVPTSDGSDDEDGEPAIGEGDHDDQCCAGTAQAPPCGALGGSPTVGPPGSPGHDLGLGECCRDPEPQQPIDPDRRTHPQRLHDALGHVLGRILGSGQLPRQGGTSTTVLLTIPLATLEARTGYASTAHGGDIPTREVIRRAGDTTFIPIVIDQVGNPLYLGRSRRLASPHQRHALHLRDGGCVIPGCLTPSPACDAHHLHDWADGGRTDITNLALLCPYHHHRIHGWTLQLKDGRIWCTAPLGMARDPGPQLNSHFCSPPPNPLFE